MRSVSIGSRELSILGLLLLSVFLCGCHLLPDVLLLIGISPNSATVGDPPVTLTVSALGGSIFDATDVVTFNGTDLSDAQGQRTKNTIVATIPASLLTTAGTFNVKVRNTKDTNVGSNSVPFTVNSRPANPQITSISPSSVVAGSGAFTLTVNGTGFVPGSAVLLNGGSSTTTFVSATQLTASILSSEISTPGIVPVTVVNPNNGTSNPVNLTITAVPAPTVVSISPSTVTAGVGATLAVVGTNFVSSSVVMINGFALTTQFSDSSHLFAILPGTAVPTPGTAQITVVNPPQQGGTSNAVTLTITPAPTLAITPTTLPDGFIGSAYT